MPQDLDTPLQRGRSGGFAWRYRYGRAAEAREANTSGQDYLTLRVGEGNLAFALCDGVSHSFFGNLAARFLGDRLLGWLDRTAQPTGDEHHLRTSLQAHLTAIVGEATSAVEHHALPSTMPQLQREALEESRQRGSETTFVCGRIDLPGTAFVEGRLLLAWMGDSTLRIWGPETESSSALDGAFDIEQRWSSRQGPVGGAPHIFVGPLLAFDQPTIVRLVAYSDGLQALDDESAPPDDGQLETLVATLAASSTSDDVSFLDIAISPISSVPTFSNVAPEFSMVGNGDASGIVAAGPVALPDADRTGAVPPLLVAMLSWAKTFAKVAEKLQRKGAGRSKRF